MSCPSSGPCDVVLVKFVPPYNIARGWLTPAPDWHLLPCAIAPHEVLNSLPGYLSFNHQETQPLSATSLEHIAFVNRHVSPGSPDWSEGKLMCMPCVLSSMGRRVLNSLRELKAQRESLHLSSPCVSGNNPTFESRWITTRGLPLWVQLRSAGESRAFSQA